MTNLSGVAGKVVESDTEPGRSENLRAALSLAAAEIPIFPVTVLRDATGKWKKKPAIKAWQNVTSCDPDQIRRWWAEFPDAVPGIELGQAGLVVIDADRHDDGADGVAAFNGLMAGYDGQGPHPKSSRAGGGEHHFFSQPPRYAARQRGRATPQRHKCQGPRRLCRGSWRGSAGRGDLEAHPGI